MNSATTLQKLIDTTNNFIVADMRHLIHSVTLIINNKKIEFYLFFNCYPGNLKNHMLLQHTNHVI